MSKKENSRHEKEKVISPKELMKDWHPDLFSDSLEIHKPLIDKEHFKFILSELSDEKKETLFEEFARRLAELEICPNIRPQSGSSGGGDGGIDADTYPVDKQLAETRYWRSVGEPTDEKTVLAISCSKTPKNKIKVDVKKIANDRDDFKKVFFISNQIIASKDRFKIEEELSEKYGLKVSILDRNWIVEKVYTNNHIELAIETLCLNINYRDETDTGSSDYRRQQELTTILSKLSKPFENYVTQFGIAEDYLQAAYFSRCLNKPVAEFESLIDKAIKNSESYGSVSQILKCIYFKGWSMYWFYENYDATFDCLNSMSEILPKVYSSDDLERYSNLFTVLLTGYRTELINKDWDIFNNNGFKIFRRCCKLAKDKFRPSNAFHASIIRSFIKILIYLRNPDRLKRTVIELQEILKQYNRSQFAPIGRYINCILELGRYSLLIPGYEELISVITSIKTNIASVQEQGEILFKHGMNLSRQGDHFGSLYNLGKAKNKLYHEDTMYALARAALKNSHTLTELENYWGARLEALSSAQICLSTPQAIRDNPLEASITSFTMAQLELYLGRFMPFLLWCDLFYKILPICWEVREDLKKFKSQLTIIDGMFSILLLKVGLDEINEPEYTLDFLEQHEMFISRASLLYLLERHDEAIEELSKEVVKDQEELKSLMDEMVASPMAKNFPDRLTYQNQTINQMSTSIMGVEFQVKCARKIGCDLFSEYLLGSLELLYCLMDIKDYAWIEDEVIFHIDENVTVKNPAYLNLKNYWHNNHINLFWGVNSIDWFRNEGRKEIAGFVIQLITMIEMNCCIDSLEDIMQRIKSYGVEEHLDRVFHLNHPFITITDIFGEECYDM